MVDHSLMKVRVIYDDGSTKVMWIKVEHKNIIDYGDILQVLGVFEPDIKIKDAEAILKNKM